MPPKRKYFTCKVSAVSGVTSGHHVLGVEHLLCELGHGQGSVLLAATGGQRGEARHEEMETGEGDHVNGQFPEVSVQLAGEPEAGGDTRHGEGDKMVQVTIGGGVQLQGSTNNKKKYKTRNKSIKSFKISEI